MIEQVQPKPPVAWLQHLYDAGHWDRLIEMAGKSLAAEPDDAQVHRFLAWAYAKLDRYQEMRPHVEFVLRDDAEEPRNHHVAAIYYLEIKQHQRAKQHIDFLLHNDSQNATYHYLACIYYLRCNNSYIARNHITEARVLSPEWAAAAHLEINMDGIHQKKAREAWNRIRRLEQTLALEPENASVMKSIGDIYLYELEQPCDAERMYRQALAIDPTDRELQQRLLKTLRTRSLIYRTLSLPSSAWLAIIRNFGTKFPASIVHMAWVLLVGAFFFPASKVFEWLVLAEVAHARPVSRWSSWFGKVLAWPLWLRLCSAMAIILGAWLLVLWAIGVAPRDALEVIAWIFGIHFGLVVLFVGLRRLRARFGRWREMKRHLQSQRPELQPEGP
jgi:tetratricopeptide (TPR) repeat protein